MDEIENVTRDHHCCPDCRSRLVKRYVTDMRGEVIGANFWCAKCPWTAVGNW